MIRKATPQDFNAILDLSQEFWKYTLFDEEFDRDHTLLMVKQSFDYGLLAALEIDLEVVGFVSGIKSFLLGSPAALMGVELAWWVTPDHRGGKNGIKLLKFIETLAREQGIKYWTMVSMESSMPEQINGLYEKLGYKKSETGFTKVF